MAEWHRPLRDRLTTLEVRPEREAEIVDELAQHLDDQVRDLLLAGHAPDAARALALAELDAPGELARRLAEIEPRPRLVLPPPGAPSRGRFIQARWQDVRHSVRSLRRSPIFAITVIATLALTIGPTTAILSIGNWLLWRPTPGVTEPHRLAVIWVGEWRKDGVSVSDVSYLNLQDLRRATKTLSGIAGIQEGSVSIAADSLPPSYATGGWVTADFADVLGVPMIAGRPFRPDDDREPQGEHVAIVSEGLARRGFGDADRAVNGRLLLNGVPMTIVGVVPERFAGITPLSRVDVWYPGATYGYVNHFGDRRLTGRGAGLFYSFVVRLAPGATFESAQAELDVIVPMLAQSHPDENGKFKTVRARLFPGLGADVLERPRYASLVRTLLIVGGVLLVLGCVNVANVLMVRSVRTARDRAIRLALGASRARLALLQLTESGLLAFGGASLGILLAIWLKQLIVTLLLPGMPAGLEFNVPLDGRVLAMTLGVAVACGVTAGLAPAIVGRRVGLAASIAAGGGRSVTGARWLRAAFAGLQLALSLALVTGSLLLVATLRNLYEVNLGFDPAPVSRHVIDPTRHGYRADRLLGYYQDLLDRVKNRAGFDAASISGRAPFGSGSRMQVQDPAGADRPPITVYTNNISAAYFDVLGTRLIRGRAFTDAEAMIPSDSATFPVIVGANLAKQLFGDADAIGRTIVIPKAGSSPARDVQVVGVAEDVHWSRVTGEPTLLLYQPLTQNIRSATLLVRSALPLADVTRIVEGAAREIDPSLPVSFSQPLTAEIERRLSDQRVFAWMLSLLGWLAFALAAVGLYGLLAQSVSERTREFGIRMAIGSGRGRIFALVLRQAAWIGAIGVVAGLGLAAFGTSIIESQLFGVARLSAPLYLMAAGALVVVVFAAGLWPARMATRIQPVEALRVE